MDPFGNQQIVEYYTKCFRIEPYRSTLLISKSHFTRYVYRPIAGHEILTGQIVENYHSSYIEHVTEGYVGDTQEELRRRIQYDLSDYNNQNWLPLATKVAALVYDQGYEGEHFWVEAEEACGVLSVSDERDGWDDLCLLLV